MATYKILTLGDSVMWGQGLLPDEKFVQLVAAHVELLGRTVEVAALPHSGAVVCTGPTPPGGLDFFLDGEIPRSFPSIESQLGIATQTPGYASFLQVNPWDSPDWAKAKQAMQVAVAGYSGPAGQPPDLILVDGGINDLGALQVAIPWDLDSPDPCPAAPVALGGPALQKGALATRVTREVLAAGGDRTAIDLSGYPWITDEKLRELIDHYVYDRMRSLVGRLAQSFPTSKVVVTGYFPIFTSGSIDELKKHPGAIVLFGHGAGREREAHAALILARHPNLRPEDFAQQVVHQSALWYTYSNQRLQAVVDEANTVYGNRFSLASPTFGPDNGALAPDALLWSFTALIDDILEKLFDLLDNGVVSPPETAVPGALAAAAAARSTFASWKAAIEFLGGLELGKHAATDQVTSVRTSAASKYYFHSPAGRSDPETTFLTGLKAGVASLGHPNVRGAAAYLAAIAPFLP
jgi:hypothetical protein